MQENNNNKSTIAICIVTSILLALSIVVYIIAIASFKPITPNNPNDVGEAIGAGCATAITSVVGIILNLGLSALAIIELPFLIISIVRLTKIKSQPNLKAMKIINVVLGVIICFLAISVWMFLFNRTGA